MWNAETQTAAESEIRERIARKGRITFAEFMELALYHPAGGYYSRTTAADPHQDYYTSPATHPVFGALIAIQLWRMWSVLGCPHRFYALEMGAGGGLLARDVVEFARALPGAFKGALCYVALDRAPGHSLPADGASAYDRLAAQGVPARGVVGCILSNELVDAFPVHRFAVKGGIVFEVYVTVKDGRFIQVLHEPSTPQLPRRISGLGAPLSEGYHGEVNLRIGPWLREVAAALKQGFVLTLDYGYGAKELYAPERSAGTLQTYFRHTRTAGPYQRIGMQDLTAHVDFSAIVSEGEAVGLLPVGLLSQAEFLRALGLERWLRKLRAGRLSQRERESNLMAMRELVRPDGLGGFKVLVQEKDTGISGLCELLPSQEEEQRLGDLPAPLLGPGRVPLMEGRYPHSAWQFDHLWPWADDEPAS